MSMLVIGCGIAHIIIILSQWVNGMVSIVTKDTHKKIKWPLSLSLTGARTSLVGRTLTCTFEDELNWRRKSIHVSVPVGLRPLQAGRTEQFENSQVVGSNVS